MRHFRFYSASSGNSQHKKNCSGESDTWTGVAPLRTTLCSAKSSWQPDYSVPRTAKKSHTTRQALNITWMRRCPQLRRTLWLQHYLSSARVRAHPGSRMTTWVHCVRRSEAGRDQIPIFLEDGRQRTCLRGVSLPTILTRSGANENGEVHRVFLNLFCDPHT